MDAKFWSEEYDKAGPPKKIDIMQMMIIELIDRPGKPIYHVETVIGLCSSSSKISYFYVDRFVNVGLCFEAWQLGIQIFVSFMLLI